MGPDGLGDKGIKRSKFSNNINSLLGPLDFAKLGLDVGAPLIFEAFESKRRDKLRNEANVDFKNIELKQPGVRGLRQRNLALPTRPATGSTLDSQIAERLFGDAFQQAQQNEFELNDENFRQQQIDRNTQIGNQATLANANLDVQEQTFNAGTARGELFQNLAGRTSTFESLFQNASQGLGQVSALDALTSTASAREVIFNPDKIKEVYGEEEGAKMIEKAKQMLAGNLRLGKTKFSR